MHVRRLNFCAFSTDAVAVRCLFSSANDIANYGPTGRGLNGAQMQLSGPGSITLSAPDGGSWCLDGVSSQQARTFAAGPLTIRDI